MQVLLKLNRQGTQQQIQTKNNKKAITQKPYPVPGIYVKVTFVLAD